MLIDGNNILGYILSEATTASESKEIIDTSKSSVTINAQLINTSQWNRNGRKYPTNVVKKAILSERIQEELRTGSWCGEAGHPLQPSVQRQAEVMKDNISHRILEVNWSGPILNGKVQTAPTDRGREMRDFILADPPMVVAFSLRGMGPVMQTKDGYVVKDPLTLITFDWVFYPSFRDAYQSSIECQKIQESVQTFGNSMFNDNFQPLNESSAISYIKEESKNYKLVAPLFEAAGKTVTLSPNHRQVIITTNILDESTMTNKKEEVHINLESYISRDIDSFYDKFNF